MITKRLKQRQRKRGVAMVEAGILAPIFAMMMMLTIYLMGIYETKYRTAMMSRYAAYSYASNACSNSQFKPITNDLPAGIRNGTSTSQSDGQVTQQQDQNGGTSGNQYTNQAQGGAQASSAMLMSHGSSTMTWDYEPTYKFNNTSSKQITSDSYVVCNTPPPQGMNIFSYLGNIISGVL